MATYDVVAGVDTGTLNALIVDVYQDVKDTLLTGVADVGRDGVASVRYEVRQAPTLEPVEPGSERHALVLEHARQVLADVEHHAVATAGVEAIARAGAGAAFVVRLPDVALHVLFDGPDADAVDVVAEITAEVVFGTGPVPGALVPTVIDLDVVLAGQQALTTILRNVVLPGLMPEVNAQLTGIVIPPLAVPVGAGVQLTAPRPVTRPPHALAFAALEGTQVEVPGPADWPAGAVFVGLSPALVQRLATAALPEPISGSLDLAVARASYGLRVRGITGVSFDAGGSVSVEVSAVATAGLQIYVPILDDPHFEASAAITLRASARAAVEGGMLTATITEVGEPDIDFDFGLPGPFEAAVDAAGVPARLAEAVFGLVGKQFVGRTIARVAVPSIPLSLAGRDYVVALGDPTVDRGPGPAGEPLLVVRTTPSFSVAGGGA